MENQLIIYPEFDERIERDYLYHVSVTQGARTETLPVYNHTEDSRVNRNPIDGRRADEFRRFSTFAFAGEGVRVDIRVGRDFHDYAVMPARKRFRHSFKDGVISVYLDRPDYFVIRLDGGDHTNLAVFADAPETELPREGEKTIVVDRWQEVEGGVLTLTEPHTTVYIPAGAVLNARIQVLADDCRIIGRGAIVDPVGDIYRYSAAALDTGGVVLIKSVNRTLVDGIHFLDAKAFNLEVIGTWEEIWATDNLVRNVKILSTQMSSDGITFCYYAKNSRAEHCFVYCGDNALVYEEYAHYRDITVGTTCNALYPQTDVVDSSAEDIYVFRADEGLINVTMGGENGITRSKDHVIRNFSAVDITFTPYFLFVEIPKSNPAVTVGDGLTVENVWLRKLSDTLTCDFYRNIAAGDYKVTLKNCSVDGILLRDITPETVGGAVVPSGHSFRYLTEGDFDPCIPSARETADYRNTLNVYVGHWQIFFPEPIRFEGGTLLRLPDVTTKTDVEELSDEEWEVAKNAICEAVNHLVAFRKQEGAALQKKFTEKVDNIQTLLASIEPYEKARVEKIRQNIVNGLQQIPNVDYDKNRLEQELIYYIEKLDISEEKQRLANHLKYFRETMNEEGHGVGKKLGFIAQEMGREINTTGSKSNQAEMQNIVVKMKDELEQIKEQVLNAL